MLTKWAKDHKDKTGEDSHFGRVFALMVEKNSELEKDNPLRKYKGRVVFQGNNVWDQNAEVAMFQALTSAPATMQGSKTADLYGCLPGHITEQADATQAYTQSVLKGNPTWIILPRERWPPEWIKKGYKNPVCRLWMHKHL